MRFEQYKRSDIFVYDNKLKLLQQTTSDILKSDINPSPVFFNGNNRFYVAYEFQTGNEWQYKLSAFDEKANLLSTYVLDSSQNIHAADSVSYNFFQSDDKATLCCVKITTNKTYPAVKFNCSFLSNSKLKLDSFFLPFDAARENLVDFLIDNENNITILKTTNTDSGFAVSLIKRKPGADYFLNATKQLKYGYLQSGTIHLASKLNEYNVYAIWESDFLHSSARYKDYHKGMYLWNTNNKLDDLPGDTIIYNDSTSIADLTLLTGNSANGKRTNIFSLEAGVTQSTVATGHYYAKDYNQQSSTYQPPAYENTTFNTSETRPSYVQLPSNPGTFILMPNEQPPPPPLPVSSFPNNNNDDNNTSIPVRNFVSGFSIFGLSNNFKMRWLNDFKDNEDSADLPNLLYKKIVAGKNGIHIIYPSLIKNKRNGIEHVLVTYDGKYEKINTIAWNLRYEYLVSQAVETNDGAIIIPCVKDNRLIFAKMIFE